MLQKGMYQENTHSFGHGKERRALEEGSSTIAQSTLVLNLPVHIKSIEDSTRAPISL